MAVIVTTPVEGLSVGDTYEGPNEAFYLENGYVRAVNPSDIPDLDHPKVPIDGYPDEEVEKDYDMIPSEFRYAPEVALETTIQTGEAGEERLKQLRSTKPTYSSDPVEEPVEEPPAEDGDEDEDPPTP